MSMNVCSLKWKVNKQIVEKRPLQIAEDLSLFMDQFSVAALCVYYLKITRPRSQEQRTRIDSPNENKQVEKKLGTRTTELNASVSYTTRHNATWHNATWHNATRHNAAR